MRPTTIMVAVGAIFNCMVQGELVEIKAACPAGDSSTFRAPVEKPNGFDSLFKVTALVRSLTSPVTYQTTTPQADLDGQTGPEQKRDTTAGSFVTAAMRPFLAALNASSVSQRARYLEQGEDGGGNALLWFEEQEDLQMQILKRTPTANQNIDSHRLSVALTLSLMMATWGWKIGSYSGLKCCVFLLFLVYFHLRSMHNAFD